MSINLSRGGAAALLTLGASLPLVAQSAGPQPARARDSAAVQVMVMRRGGLDSTIRVHVDSIWTLMRAYEEAQPGSPSWVTLKKQIEELIPFSGRLSRARAGGGGFASGLPRIAFRSMNPAALPKGWIGFTTSGPHSESMNDDGQIVTYFDYPTIVTVDGHSPAERAGIMRGDELVAYNGLDVVGRALNLTQLLVPEKKLLVTIRRGGETKDYPVIVAKASERIDIRRLELNGLPLDLERAQIERAHVQGRTDAAGSAIFAGPGTAVGGGSLPMGGRFFVIAPNGVFGASASSVGPELARALKLETGVLVNDVPEETPASKAGLRPGDVIVGVAGRQVASLHELQRLIETRAADRSVALRIMRDKKPRNITVRW
jgi:hypothetical protein